MKEEFYDFDPCKVDGSDVEEEDFELFGLDEDDVEEDDEEEMTIDKWKPKQKQRSIVQSNWRKKLIGNDFNRNPGIDDLKKIKMYLNKKYPDFEIMETFGVNADTLAAIKKNKYCPVDGISLDNLSKIHNAFDLLEKHVTKVKRGIKYLSDILFIDPDELKKFNDFCNKKDIKKSILKEEFIEDEYIASDE